MRQPQQQTITVDDVIKNYQMLSSTDPETKYRANQFLCALPHRDESWNITQTMITTVQEPQFQFIGSQILYQKVASQIKNLSPESKNQLRNFVFSKLQDPNINYVPIIDKLSSIGALIGSTSVMNQWKSFVQDLINFMTKGQHNLKSGLYVIQRIPQQLRGTNRLSPGQKNAIADEILKYQKTLCQVFYEILNMNNPSLVKKCLQAMESWAKSRFNFLKFTQLIKKVLLLSVQSFDNFQSAIIMTLETIKGAASNKYSMGISDWQPIKQIQKYDASQIQSIKLIIQYIAENKKNFVGNDVETQYVDMYLDIIKQSLLNFGFLINQNIGFEMLNIIMVFTKGHDLKTSQSTFQFWMDYSQKMSKCKVSSEIKNKFAQYIDQLFKVVSIKTAVNSQQLLQDPDLKQDVTIDDLNAMSFDEYRKQTITLYQYIYNYFLAVTGSPNYYFNKCFQFIGTEQNTSKLGVGTQMALFCVKAPIQSMITDADAEFICKITNFIISKGASVYPRIIVQTLLLIRDCTRELKKDSSLSLSALNYTLYFLNNDKICHYAAQAFKTLMQTLTTISDPGLISNLIKYYSSQAFPSEQIIDKIIQGIFLAITKMNNINDVGTYITQLVQIVLHRFQNIHKNLKPTDDRPYLIPMLQIKTILDNFESSAKQFQNKYPKYTELYGQILSNSLKMIMIVIPYCLKQKLNYVKFNQLGLSCSIYKLALKLCVNQIQPEFLQILDQTLVVLDKQTIIQKYPLLQLTCFTMTNFVGKSIPRLNQWLFQRIPYINGFFLTYLDPISYADPDVIKIFYEVQQSLVLYNSQIFLKIGNALQIFDIALYVLRHINQAKMQRKVVNFLYICCQMQEIYLDRFTKVAQHIIGSVPIVAGLSHHNLSRMFLIVAQRIPNIRQLLISCLKQNPYEGLPEQIIILLVNLMMLIIQPAANIPINIRQRNFMMIIKDLNQLAKTAQIPNKALQLQFRYNQWKRNKMVLEDNF